MILLISSGGNYTKIHKNQQNKNRSVQRINQKIEALNSKALHFVTTPLNVILLLYPFFFIATSFAGKCAVGF